MEREEAKRQAAKREAEAKRVRAMAMRVAAEAEAEGRRKAAASPPKPRSKQQQVIEEARRLAGVVVDLERTDWEDLTWVMELCKV